MELGNIAAGVLMAGSLGAGAYGGYRAHQAITDHGAKDTPGRLGASAGGAVGAVAGGMGSVALSFGIAGMDTAGNSKVLSALTGVTALGGLALGAAGLGAGAGLLQNGILDGVGAARE